ncbi:MAG: SpoIIE family protein phosphatase [Lachnospiraceae bacterium]|nr:SpoIIE family protein phosphatase [Lachnospiraceae bacterium]
MKQNQKRVIVQLLFGFLMGRVVLLERNPAGAAFFAAGYVHGGGIPMLLSICLGMASALPMESVLRYGVSMVGVMVAGDLLRRQQVKLTIWQASGLMAATLAVLSVTQYAILPFQWKDILFTILEPFLVMALARVFVEGQNFLKYFRKGKRVCQEEILSLVFMGMLGLYGVPEVVISDISLTQTIVFWVVAFAGYQYGIGLGAATGAAGGILLALMGQDSGFVGSLCLMGLMAALFRKQGKMWSLLSYILTGFGIGLTLDKGMLEPGVIKALAVDCILLAAAPDSLLRKLRISADIYESVQERYDGRQMKKKLREFAASFRQLSRVLEKQSVKKTGVDHRDIRLLMKEMSEQVCEKCNNREYCMGQVAVNKPDVVSHLLEMQEQGMLRIDQMPSEFVQECIHPDWFLMEANQGLRMARTVMSFQNQLAQNRRVLAGQMEQVGQLLENLAGDMGQAGDIPEEMEHVIKRELAGIRVKVHDIMIYRDKKEHIEVCMHANTVKGRLVTAREAAGVLADLFGRPFMPSRDSHNVIPKKETELVFVEDTPLLAVTGVGRRRKEGEEVSGDSFSCLSLPNGELFLALSDGMGSGRGALGESSAVIELLEQMTEAGFSKISALKLINSLYMPESVQASFATADIVVIDLYRGNCQFMKNGAAATWILHGDNVRRIEGQALPVGAFEEAEPYFEKTEIYSGDYVIMMTDGIVDAFGGREEDLEELLRHRRIINPQELAEYITEEAVAQNGGAVRDDMSVVVAAVWERSREHSCVPSYKNRQVRLS